MTRRLADSADDWGLLETAMQEIKCDYNAVYQNTMA